MNANAMQLQGLELKTLVNFDAGYFEALVNAALKKIAADLNDRPGVKKSRSVDITLSFKPNLAEDGSCDSVMVGYTIQYKTPPAERKDMPLGIAADGEMTFRGVCGVKGDDPSQQILPLDFEPVDDQPEPPEQPGD